MTVGNPNPEGVDPNADRARVGEEPMYRDEGVLREMYLNQKLSLYDMADVLDCGVTTLRNWMDKYGIDRRDNSGQNHVSYSMKNRYPHWHHQHDNNKHILRVHRLLAVSKYGFDAVADGVVHHKNGIGLDNRPDNIVVYSSQAEHQRRHIEDQMHLTHEERVKLAVLHETTELTHEQLAEEFGITKRLSQKIKSRYLQAVGDE